MIVVQPKHLKANPSSVEAFAAVAITMISMGCFFHKGWRVGFEIYNDRGIMRRRLLALPPDHGS
jgi:hypothetical protein